MHVPSQRPSCYTPHLRLQLPRHKCPIWSTTAHLHPHVGQADHLGLESASLLDTDNHGQRGRLRGDALSRPQKRPLEVQGLWGLLAGAHTLIGQEAWGLQDPVLSPLHSLQVNVHLLAAAAGTLGHWCLRITVSLSSAGGKERQSQRSAGRAGVRGPRAGPSGASGGRIMIHLSLQKNWRTSLVVQWLRIPLPMHGFPWSGKISHAWEQLNPCATTTECCVPRTYAL